MSQPLITLLTDFGTADAYAGVVKGVLLSVCPRARLVDLTHQVPPFSILQGAFLLWSAWPHFPPETVHLAVVDPGVGTERRALAVATPRGTFVGPDNGLLTLLVQDALGEAWPTGGRALGSFRAPLPPGWRAVELREPRWWRHPVSPTFHARDIFAPVAGHLARGVPLEELGPAVADLACLYLPRPAWRGNKVEGVVAHIDRFGNLVTNIPAPLVQGVPVTVEVAGQSLRGLAETYSRGQGLMALIGSAGTLEVAVREGSAAAATGARVGERVVVRRATGPVSPGS